jgi:hypothetical protein
MLLATSPDRRRAEGWVLVLLSLGMHPNLQQVPGGFALFVRVSEAAKARAELEATEAEEAEAWRDRIADTALATAPATRGALAGGVAVSAALLAFHVVTGPSHSGSTWFAAGASDANLVLHGEWWRAITALTLHADPAHVTSNAGIGAIVMAAVMRSMGVGWGAALMGDLSREPPPGSRGRLYARTLALDPLALGVAVPLARGDARKDDRFEGAGGGDLGRGTRGFGALGIGGQAGGVGVQDRLGQRRAGRGHAEAEVAVGLFTDRALGLGGVDHRLLLGGLGEGRARGHAEGRDGRRDDEKLAE